MRKSPDCPATSREVVDQSGDGQGGVAELEETTVSKFFSALEDAERQLANRESGPRASEASQGPGAPAETRQRMTRWLEEGQQLLGTFRLLLTENEHLRERVQAAEREGRALRAELEEATVALTRLVSETLEPAVTRLKHVRPRPSATPPAMDGLGPTGDTRRTVAPVLQARPGANGQGGGF